MVQRLTYRTRNTYNTASNKQKVVKTPGNKLVYQRIRKAGAKVKCGDCKKPLNGIPALRPREYSRLDKHERTVSRAYGGSRCPKCVRSRILRAFLYEEKRCVAAVLMEKKRQKKAETTKATKSGKKTTKKH
eukprot:Gregarina_sp_Pseudo_9__5394@NODE_659_length_2415_cov_85_136785_g622_i0_p3_GENE_NODE_659_length_2415_cov_85_136785_g622_i0NODE_659_length_2415_cov_85_136785_g622_i0_p3_ORF_typecomplete_len131_score27_04Ribosomal_L34e/PF01199_18/5_6e44Ribosomal_L34e/PF01199_18/2_3e03Glycoprotein_G/PF00802_19/0_016zinc_ribbon_5/PF13719_6/0_11zinc_ribbon_5/PF13719_6/1_2e02zinc_ribbon_4/PF13717_6/0_23zinc_ribbon_4/PF13717_6/1_5e02_NODE_659_length_2415_cov_85_136785_g622_i099491